MNAYVATKNPGKFRELKAIFDPLGWQLDLFPDYADVEEGAASYAANAALKANALAAQLKQRGLSASVIGDDSGLEVSALDGRPGVLSARYGGASATWAQRRSALLNELSIAGAGRSAAFICALHFIGADGTERAVLSRLDGEIAEEERGEAGFSYDPIFQYPPLDATFGELEEGVKNAISHRALAARALIRALATQAGGTEAQKVGEGGT